MFIFDFIFRYFDAYSESPKLVSSWGASYVYGSIFIIVLFFVNLTGAWILSMFYSLMKSDGIIYRTKDTDPSSVKSRI